MNPPVAREKGVLQHAIALHRFVMDCFGSVRIGGLGGICRSVGAKHAINSSDGKCPEINVYVLNRARSPFFLHPAQLHAPPCNHSDRGPRRKGPHFFATFIGGTRLPRLHGSAKP